MSHSSLNEDVFKSDSIKVNLEPLVNQLGNVTVKPYDLSGDLMSDIKKVEKKETIKKEIKFLLMLVKTLNKLLKGPN